MLAGYDAVAAPNAERFFDELDHKPLDRLLLDHLATITRWGRVCDMGCGPGEVAAYLHRHPATRGHWRIRTTEVKSPDVRQILSVVAPETHWERTHQPRVQRS